MKRKLIFVISLILMIIMVFSACNPIDKDYGVSSKQEETDVQHSDSVEDSKILSSDRVMSKYFDISLFDEENYSQVYLGKKFEIDALFNDGELPVPTNLNDMAELGWKLAEVNSYDENSLVFSHETIEVTLENSVGSTVDVKLYNSSRSSVRLSKCYIVDFYIENDFYANPEGYDRFNINGITNSMALTDIIEILGTPSHFYKVSENCYYLDYFISKRDRRNGITIYINPVDDLITAIEFSYYK